MMMETLMVDAHNRSQYQNRGRAHTLRSFEGINCRTFHSGGDVGIIPSPPPKTYSFNGNYYSEPPKCCQSILLSSSPPSPRAISFSDDYDYSELWAGPAYSNSPPPSSLPMPKFSLGQKWSVSLELTVRKPDVLVVAISKSAPSSPIREYSSSDGDFLLFNATATEDLKRILNLDVGYD